MSKILKEFSFISVSSIIGQLISLASVFLISTTLGPDDYGKLNIILIPILILPIFLNLGIPNAVFRFFNTSNDKIYKSKVLNTGILFSFVSSIIIGLIIFFLALIIQLPAYFDNTIPAIVLLSIVISNSNVLTTVLRANRDFKFISLVSIINPTVKILIVILLYFTKSMTFVSLLLANLITELLIFIFLITNNNINIKKFSFSVLKNLLTYSVSFIPHKFFSKFNKPLFQILIARYLGYDYAGFFALAEKVSLPLSFLIDKIQFIWEPIKFQIHQKTNTRSIIFQTIIPNFIIIMLFVTSLYALFEANFLPYSIFKDYTETPVIAYFLIQLCFLRGLYYFAGTGIELSSIMYILPISSGGNLLIIFLFNFISFEIGYISLNILLLSLFISELYSIILVRLHSKKNIFIKFNYDTYLYLLLFLCLNFYLLLFNDFEKIKLFSVLSFISFTFIMLINRNRLKDLKKYSNI